MKHKMTYNESLDYLNSFKTYGTKLGLDRMRALCKALGNPQDYLKFVHIAGTNGKGSTASFCYHMLKEAGYKTGLFTSPYIQKFNERIVIGTTTEINITDVQLANHMNKIRDVLDNDWDKYFSEPPTWFEILTCLSFLFFKEQNCDIVVLEVGLGGDLDSTNVINSSLVSIITIIGYDHMDVLGSTIEEIAAKKAGIIKKEGTVVVYPQGEEVIQVIEEKAKKQQATIKLVNEHDIISKEYNLKGQIFDYKDFYNIKIKMLGTHQVYNASVAVAAMLELRSQGYNLTDDDIKQGLLKTTWPGRLEIVQKEPLFLLDGAHNTQGTANLSKNLKILFPYSKFVFIVGVLEDKEYKEMLSHFYDIAFAFITVTPDETNRAMPASKLADFITANGSNAISIDSIENAILLAIEIAEYEDLPICGFGSLYYIGQVRDYYDL